MESHSVVIVDDHVLLAQAISSLVNSFPNYHVAYICSNGKEFIDKLNTNTVLPEIVLMDIKMPILNGIETTEYLKNHFQAIKVLALSVEADEETIIKMLKAGAKGYLLKDVEKQILHKALNQLITEGYYHTKKVSSILINSLNTDSKFINDKLKDREIEFLKLICCELTYKEIADKMCLSPKTIDGYRDSLFEKLNIRNRIGLVLYAVRNKIVEI